MIPIVMLYEKVHSLYQLLVLRSATQETQAAQRAVGWTSCDLHHVMK